MANFRCELNHNSRSGQQNELRREYLEILSDTDQKKITAETGICERTEGITLDKTINISTQVPYEVVHQIVLEIMFKATKCILKHLLDEQVKILKIRVIYVFNSANN